MIEFAINDLIDHIDKYWSYQPCWDEDDVPIMEENIIRVEEFIRKYKSLCLGFITPDLGFLGDGSIDLYWKFKDKSFLLNLEFDGSGSFYGRNKINGTEINDEFEPEIYHLYLCKWMII
jgi:hypothetical protein